MDVGDKLMLEMAAMERKLEKLKRSNGDTLKQLADAQSRGRRLANSLGFHDIYEAQVMVDNADVEIPFIDCIEKIELLEKGVAKEKNENERLKEALGNAEDERDALRLRLAAMEER